MPASTNTQKTFQQLSSPTSPWLYQMNRNFPTSRKQNVIRKVSLQPVRPGSPTPQQQVLGRDGSRELGTAVAGPAIPETWRRYSSTTVSWPSLATEVKGEFCQGEVWDVVAAREFGKVSGWHVQFWMKSSDSSQDLYDGKILLEGNLDTIKQATWSMLLILYRHRCPCK